MTIKETSVTDEESQTAEPEIVIPAPNDLRKDAPVVSKPAISNFATTNDNLEEVEFPNAFYCPLTKKVMTDPVVHPDGDSYEREAIVNRQNDDSLLAFYPNRALKAYIEQEMERVEEAGSMRGTIRTWDTSLRNGWDKFVEKAALPLGESRPLPDEFYCTLTLDLCHEPVIDPDGYTYERQAIVHWVTNNGDSPVTRKALTVEQLYDNNSILNIILEESEKPDDAIHPCIRRWKEELSSPPPSIVPEVSTTNAAETPGGGIPIRGVTNLNDAIVPMNISRQHATTDAAQYPTTHEEMEERMAREHRKSMVSLLMIIVIISFALVYLPFYLVVFALAFCSCLYARSRFHSRRRRGRYIEPREGNLY
jgi:hypothetical protein